MDKRNDFCGETFVAICDELNNELMFKKKKNYKKIGMSFQPLSQYLDEITSGKLILLQKKKYDEYIKEKDTVKDIVKEHLTQQEKDQQRILELEIQLQKIQKIGTLFTKKLECLISLRKTINNLCKESDCTINGSYVRQLFELPRALSELFATKGYGNSIGRDVDLYIYPSKPSNEQIVEINQKITELDKFIKLHKLLPAVIQLPKFGDYQLTEISDSTINYISPLDPVGKKKLMNVPHYLFILVDSNNIQLTIDVLGWKPETDPDWSSVDFDVNSLTIKTNGILVDSPFVFDEVLLHLLKKEVSCEIDLEKLHNVLYKRTTRENKFPSLNQFIFFLTNRIKIISCGYDFKSVSYKIPRLKIIRDEACALTAIESPYISLELTCGHSISLMIFIGMITERNDYTEALRCPFCRFDLAIVFEEKKPSEIKYWKPEIPEINSEETKNTYLIEQEDEMPLFSTAAAKYISDVSHNIHEVNGYVPEMEPIIGPTNIQRTVRRRINTNASVTLPDAS